MNSDYYQNNVPGQIRDVLCDYTVPIHTFENNRMERVSFVQSGVLVRLDKRHFVLTAGHCVRDWNNKPMAFGVRGSAHRFVPQIVASAYRYDAEADYGFWEIAPRDVGEFSYKREFVDSSQIEILNIERVHNKEGATVLTGYPGDLVIGDWNRNPASRFLSYLTVVAGTEDASGCTYPSELSEEHPVIDLVIAEENYGDSSEVPVLKGASGGGYWWMEPVEEGTQLTDAHFRLVAIHAGIYYTEAGEFTRGYLIESHLRLIADVIPELNDFIHKTWPNL